MRQGLWQAVWTEDTECGHLTLLQKPRQSVGFLGRTAYYLSQDFSFTYQALSAQKCV